MSHGGGGALPPRPSNPFPGRQPARAPLHTGTPVMPFVGTTGNEAKPDSGRLGRLASSGGTIRSGSGLPPLAGGREWL